MSGKVREYENQDIIIQYDVQRCIHSAECVRGLPAVFDPGKRPWINPDNASADDIAAVVQQCPTGALQFVRKDGGAPEPTPEHNTIEMGANGPLYMRGNIQIKDQDGTVVHTDTRVALCRCGVSKNKPFCDGSHSEAGFLDTGLYKQQDEQAP